MLRNEAARGEAIAMRVMALPESEPFFTKLDFVRCGEAELRELATLPELAGFEWRDEAVKMLAAWEAADEARRRCAIL